ncbi:hypothetical protein ABZ815_39855 [Nonomuraea sp. NPDC047529]|uniref:hypothetical protein n=1 Tax=Nonomuraea sp. NPDC047529 TaxID=3155623 RepID=UPI003402B09D
MGTMRKEQIHRFAATVLAATLATGCSMHSVADTRMPAKPAGSRLASPRSSLTDLTEVVKQRIILHHVGEEDGEWRTSVKVGNNYQVAVDCVGAVGQLELSIDSSSFPRKCSTGFNVVKVGGFPRQEAMPRQLVVKAPPGARWALLIAERS